MKKTYKIAGESFDFVFEPEPVKYLYYQVTVFFDGGSRAAIESNETAALKAAVAQLPEGVKLTGRHTERVPVTDPKIP